MAIGREYVVQPERRRWKPGEMRAVDAEQLMTGALAGIDVRAIWSARTSLKAQLKCEAAIEARAVAAGFDELRALFPERYGLDFGAAGRRAVVEDGADLRVKGELPW